MPKIKLRDGGIYTLTDKSEFVMCKSTIGAGYLLYHTAAWRQMGTPEYRVHEDGRLSRQGRITHWRVKHLIDTNRNVDEFSPVSVTTTAGATMNKEQQ
ncbi:MAG: hypothetical protein WKF84_04895 [Pyrinomonadaceae bacterium]